MGVFAYRALDGNAQQVSGTIIADSPRRARDVLRERGLHLEQVGPLASERTHWILPRLDLTRFHRGRVGPFFRELSTLLSVGVPLVEALDVVAKQSSGTFRGIVQQLRDAVASGVGLAQAMSRLPRVFDEMAVQIVEVGEHSGTLEQSLESIAAYRERAQLLRGRIGNALAYPLIVICLGVLVAIFIVTAVLPDLLTVLAESGKELPPATRLLKAVSDLLVNGWWMLLTGAVVLLFGAAGILRTDMGRRAAHRVQLRVPVLGGLIRKQAVVRICVIVATLLRSGVSFVRALQIAQRATSNTVISRALADCEVAVIEGRDIGPSLERTAAFPATVVHVFAVGQESGKLEEMLDRLAIDYDRQVVSASQRLATILEPVLIIALALFVGAIAFATIMPILEAGDVL